MRPAIRVQYDYDVQAASDEATWHPDPHEKPNTRQEFKDDCDINKILQRGGIPAFTRQPTYGDIDYDQDLAAAIAQVRQADTLFSQLPNVLREQYKNRNNLIRALANGQITRDLQEWLKSEPPTEVNHIQELTKWLKDNHTEPTPSPTERNTSPAAAAAGPAS